MGHEKLHMIFESVYVYIYIYTWSYFVGKSENFSLKKLLLDRDISYQLSTITNVIP